MANPKSLSQRASEMSRSCCVMLCFGVGVNLRPKPRSELAEGGSVPLVVRLWKARFVTYSFGLIIGVGEIVTVA